MKYYEKDHRTEATGYRLYECRTRRMDNGRHSESGRPIRQVNHSQRKPRTLSGDVPERRGSSLKQGIQRRGYPVNAGFIITSSAPPVQFLYGESHYIIKAARNRLFTPISDPFLAPPAPPAFYPWADIWSHIIPDSLRQNIKPTSDAAVKLFLAIQWS